MNATDWWLLQMNEAQRMLELVIGDVTAEMLAWTPPTTTNAVLWESARWGAQLGIAAPPRGWDNLKTTHLNLAAFRVYGKVVFVAAKGYVGSLTEAVLEIGS